MARSMPARRRDCRDARKLGSISRRASRAEVFFISHSTSPAALGDGRSLGNVRKLPELGADQGWHSARSPAKVGL
jgi:hypothetical protein